MEENLYGQPGDGFLFCHILVKGRNDYVQKEANTETQEDIQQGHISDVHNLDYAVSDWVHLGEVHRSLSLILHFQSCTPFFHTTAYCTDHLGPAIHRQPSDELKGTPHPCTPGSGSALKHLR